MEIAKQTCQINRRWEPAPKEVTISCPRNETSRAMCHVERTSWIWHAVFGHDPKDGRDTSLQSELHLGNMCIPWCEGHSQHISLQQICTPTGHLQITRNIIDISSPDKIWITIFVNLGPFRHFETVTNIRTWIKSHRFWRML